MKKHFLNLFLIFIVTLVTTGFVYANSKNDLDHDINLYETEIDVKTKNVLKETENILINLDSLLQEIKTNPKAKQKINENIKSLESQYNNLMKYYEQVSKKLKTKIYQELLNNTSKLLKLRNDFTHEILAYTLKHGKLDRDVNAEITNKYAPKLNEIFKAIMSNYEEINNLSKTTKK